MHTNTPSANAGPEYVRLFNNVFQIEFVPQDRLPNDLGECEDPASESWAIPKILVRDDLNEQDTLIVLIHEMAHGCEWKFLSEEWVSEMSEHLGRALHQLGYRRVT